MEIQANILEDFLGLIIIIIGATGVNLNILSKKPVHNARKIVLESEIDLSFIPGKTFKDFINININRSITRLYYREVLFINITSKISMLCFAIAFFTLLTILVMSSFETNVPNELVSIMSVSIVFNIILILACQVFSNNISISVPTPEKQP